MNGRPVPAPEQSRGRSGTGRRGRRAGGDPRGDHVLGALAAGDGPGARRGADHRIHVAGLRIDCRYCHQGADRAAYAGLPATAVCVSCHTPLWLSSQVFTGVRQSLASNRPIPWRRVNQLPDFVFFNHAIHARGGIGCESCHGRVDRMAQVSQAAPLTMSWCVGCHRNEALGQ